MVRPKKQSEPATAELQPDALERKRVKKLALSNNILSNTPAKPYSSLRPSNTLIKHHGKDVIRKSHRKSKFLFSFPALIAPISGGGKIGELTNLATKNPLLYLDFPQGRLKLFGTIVYPENRYLTLQFSRGGKSVMCEDYFDNMIVFCEAWWIGTKEENPEEARLDFPKELIKAPSDEYDFKGGAGGTTVNKLVGKKSETRTVEVDSPESKLETDSSDDKTSLKDLKDVTPSRQSARMAGKKFKFTEVSSGDDSLESDYETFQKEEKKVKISSARVLNIDNEITSTLNTSEEDQSTATVKTKSKKRLESSDTVAASKEESHSNHGSLVQATISSLFKKAQEKENVEEKTPSTSRKSSLLKDSDEMRRNNLKRKTDKVNVEGSYRKTKVAKGDKTGQKVKAKKEQHEDNDDDDDDDIEDFSSSSEDNNEGSDEDWEG